MAVFAFLRALSFAVGKSDISVLFKVGQVRALEAIYLGQDVLGVLPTGYGKSLIFQLIPDLIAFRRHELLLPDVSDQCSDVEVRRDTIVIVVCPLDSLMANQKESLIQKGISSTVLRCGKVEFAKADIDKEYLSDSSDDDELGKHRDDLELSTDRDTIKMMRNGEFRILFTHPEAIVASKEGRSLLQTQVFQAKVVACVVDEAHCIDNW